MLISLNKLLMSNRTKIISETVKTLNRRQAHSEKKTKVYPRRIFSGIQPTGSVHLGNYLGAIKEWVKLQNSNDSELYIWSIVDMHAITMPKNFDNLQTNIRNIVAILLACGIDPERSILYQQSTIPLHAQLHWVIGCMTTLPKLNQLPQLKEKSVQLKDVPLGLLSYPVLQTADIMLYKATHVPVGEDQLSHLHLSQHLVSFFNGKFGQTFPMPQALINSFCGRIKSLREPTKKMSKSSEYKKSCIFLTDPPEIIREYIKKSMTDFTSEVTYEPESRPGVSNLVAIHSLISGKSPEEICRDVADLNTGQYKLLLADVVIEHLKPIREEYNRIIEDPHYVNEVLKLGTARALPIAQDCWHEVTEKIGFSSKILGDKTVSAQKKVEAR